VDSAAEQSDVSDDDGESDAAGGAPVAPGGSERGAHALSPTPPPTALSLPPCSRKPILATVVPGE
jgi:hypothetical protein